MKVGILWYDANPKLAAQDRLAEAAARYADRFGHAANCCHVNPAEVFDDPSVQVVADPVVLPHHLWVGYDESLAPAATPRVRRKRSA
ncbi:MAG: hypothetical protein IT305_23430 [Chloroflexi bacterium]|nr:hypothetical protein [Chloroflexota bacterium]